MNEICVDNFVKNPSFTRSGYFVWTKLSRVSVVKVSWSEFDDKTTGHQKKRNIIQWKW